MEIGKLINWLITLGFILASLGTLGEVRDCFREKAWTSTQSGMFSLGKFNRMLLKQ